MPSAPRYFLREDGRRTGPHSLSVLKQKAEMGLISADTLMAQENEPEAWAALRDSQVLYEELLPASPHYTLAPREIIRVNHADNPATRSVEEMLRANLARQQQVEDELLKPLPPRSNRRMNDYLFIVAGGAGVSMIPWLFVTVTKAHILLSLGATAFIASCAAWVMFGVMDRY